MHCTVLTRAQFKHYFVPVYVTAFQDRISEPEEIKRCLFARMRCSYFRSVVFVTVVIIIGLYGSLLRIHNNYSATVLSYVDKRNLPEENVTSRNDYSDVPSVDCADDDVIVNEKDAKSPVYSLDDEISRQHSMSNASQFDDVDSREISSPHVEIVTGESLLKLEEHDKSEQRQSTVKSFGAVEPNSKQLETDISNIIPSSSLRSKSMQHPKPISTNHLTRSSTYAQPSTKGYVLAVNYYEQQSMGSRNLFQLQCWAQHLGLSVVKPVMKDSFLLTPLDNNQQSSFLKFEDSFNLDEWTKRTDHSHFSPLVEWSDFLSKAPRDVILVQYNYPSVSVLKSRQKAGEPVLQNHIGDRYKSGCGTKWPASSQEAFLRSNAFHVVRSVCFNFYHGDQLSLDEFDAHLLGDHRAGNVTIVMDLWRGLGTGQRVLIKDACTNVFPINEYISLSDRLNSDASRYIQTYLGGRPFIAVMGRLEMTLLTVHKKEPVLPFCLNEIIAELNSFKRDAGVNGTFLSIDIGRYGSKKWRTSIDPELQQEFSTFIRKIYGPTTSVNSWERTFEDIAKPMTKDAGYIGLLQKAIVTQAKCVLFVGGGAFQRHALHLYRQLHPKSEECLRVVSSCTSSTKFRL